MRLLKFGALAAVAAAVLVWAVAWGIESTAITVHLIHAADEPTIAANRFAFEDDGAEATDDAVIAIYGTRSGSEPERIVFPDESKIIRPKEKPGLVCYAKGDERVWQVQAVRYLARVVSIGAAVAGFVLTLLLVYLRRRRAARDGASA